MAYLGDFRLGDTFDTKFTTVTTTGVPTVLAGSPVISAYVGNSTTEITAGITLSVSLDSVVGMNNVRVVATSGNGYATASNYQLVITTGTVGGASVVGYVVGEFSIENRSALMPTTAARTLDVTATGEGGVDWSNVGAPTTALALTGTTIAVTQKVDVDTIKTNPVVNGGTVTFPTTATLASTTNITAGTIATVTTLTNLPSIPANWLTATGINADAITAAKIADGAIDAATFAAGAINAAAIAADAITDAKVASDVTIASVTGAVGSVTGAVGSVTGAVGSVTGNVGGNVVGTVASVVGAVASVTGNVGGNVTGSIGSLATQAKADVNAEADTALLDVGLTSTVTGRVDAAVSTRLATSGYTAPLDAAGTRSAVGLASANLDTQLSTIAGYIDTEVAAIIASIAALNNISAAQVLTQVQSALTATLADSVPADGTRPSVSSGIYMLVQFLLERSVSGTTATVYKPDGTTSLFTLLLNDATSPTAVTRDT